MQNFHNSVTLVGVGKEATMSDRTFERIANPVRQNWNKTRGTSVVIPDEAMMLPKREGKAWSCKGPEAQNPAESVNI